MSPRMWSRGLMDKLAQWLDYNTNKKKKKKSCPNFLESKTLMAIIMSAPNITNLGFFILGLTLSS